MKYINWDSEKNEILKKTRGLSFEEVALMIEGGEILDIIENPGYSNQYLFIFNIENYAVVVPYVETDNEIFLKTAFPSRKFSKIYGLGENK